MVIKIKNVFGAAMCLCFGLANHAVAGAINGSYSYQYSSSGNDASCTAPADGTRDFFNSTGGGNSIGTSDPVMFSICDGAIGLLDGGEFTIGSLTSTATGVFNGSYAGVSTDPGSLPDGGLLAGGSLFDGTFTIDAGTGAYADIVGDTGTFVVNTGAPDPAGDQNNGTFVFTSTPEPVSLLTAGAGLLLIGLRKRLRKA